MGQFCQIEEDNSQKAIEILYKFLLGLTKDSLDSSNIVKYLTTLTGVTKTPEFYDNQNVKTLATCMDNLQKFIESDKWTEDEQKEIFSNVV